MPQGRTGAAALGIALGASKLDIDEVNLELLFGLDANQKGRTTTRGDDLVGVVRRLEHKCEGTLEFFKHGLDEFSEAGTLVGLRVVDVLREDGNSFGVSLGLELVSALLKNKTKGGSVGHNTVVDDSEFGLGVRPERVAVYDGGGTVGSPTSVRNRNPGDKRLGGVDAGFGDALAEASDLADLLEEKHLSGLVAIDTYSRRVVATVFLAGETVAEDLTDRLPVRR